jgi:hypothetical protein
MYECYGGELWIGKKESKTRSSQFHTFLHGGTEETSQNRKFPGFSRNQIILLSVSVCLSVCLSVSLSLSLPLPLPPSVPPSKKIALMMKV